MHRTGKSVLWKGNAMKRDETKTMLLLFAFFSLPVMYLALAAAPYLGAGLGGMLQGIILALEKQNIVFCKDSLKTVLLFCWFTQEVSAFILACRKTIAGARSMAPRSGGIRRQLEKNICRNHRRKTRY